MNKKHIHHLWTKLRKISYWYLLAVCVVSGVVAVFALRQNNLTALRLRDEVLKVDQQNGDTETALKKLREHIYAHMNTDLASNTSVYPPIQLKYRYERLVEAEKERVQATQGNLYNDAQVYCEKNFPASFYGAGRLPCIQDYLDSRPAAPKEQTIPDSLYKYNFASPLWSPDLAGWSLLVFVFFLLMFVIRFLLELWLRRQLKSHL